MSDDLPILQNPAVAERVSTATRRVLEARAEPASRTRFLDEETYHVLQIVVETILPQSSMATTVDIAAAIDGRLASGEGNGWRYAELPPDGEAFRQGLSILARMLEATPLRTLDRMPPPARESYLRCVANGDVDGPAQFPLSRWLTSLRVEVVRTWMAHPDVMHKLELYGFADGITGTTDGPTETEGWSAITANQAKPFEQNILSPQRAGEPDGAA